MTEPRSRIVNRATLAHITIEWIPPAERDFHADAYRVTAEPGNGYTVTERELDGFDQQLSWIKRDEEAQP